MENPDKIDVELLLTLTEVNKILDALSEKPYKQVSELIQKIHNQATPQVIKASKKNETKPAPTPSGE